MVGSTMLSRRGRFNWTLQIAFASPDSQTARRVFLNPHLICGNDTETQDRQSVNAASTMLVNSKRSASVGLTARWYQFIACCKFIKILRWSSAGWHRVRLSVYNDCLLNSWWLFSIALSPTLTTISLFFYDMWPNSIINRHKCSGQCIQFIIRRVSPQTHSKRCFCDFFSWSLQISISKPIWHFIEHRLRWTTYWHLCLIYSELSTLQKWRSIDR